jgi:serine/threonine-protein kinase RsbW
MEHKLRVDCLRNNLKRIREFVELVLKPHEMRLNPILVNQMIVAVDELCANVIIHGNRCNPSEQIDITACIKDDEFVFEVVDSGSAPYDINQHQCPNIEEIVKNKQRGGMGVMLIRSIMDTVRIFQTENKNIYHISKRIA